MAAGQQVTLTFAGDSDKLERAFDRVGAAARKMKDDVTKSTNESAGRFKAGITDAARLAVPAAAAAAGLLGAVMAPALAAALAGGVVLALGGGVLLAGVLAAARDPGVAAAFSGLGTRAQKALAGFGEPFKEPLKRAADTFGDAIVRMAPTINALGKTFAPLIDKLAPALAGMAEKALPGIAAAAEQAAPAFEMIAGFLPTVGEWIGKVVQKFGELAEWGVRNAESIGRFLSVAAPIVGIFLGIIAAIKIWIAVQTALNVVMALNPIGLIVIAVAALVAVIIVIATKTRFFQDTWRVVWTNVKKWALAFWDWIKNLPSMLGRAFSALTNIITAPFRFAFNTIARLWNSTVGKLSFNVPSWVPIIGGNGFSMPQVPTFHAGGVVPGPPGREVLALLQAGERVTPAGGSGGGLVLEVRSGGSRLNDLLVEIIAHAVRTGDIDLRAGVSGA